MLFAEEGFDGTSIRSIAKAAGVNVAMISYYFGSKDKLLEAMIIFRTAGLRLELENIHREDLSPVTKIERFVALYIERINKNRAMYQILHFELSSKKRVMDLAAFTSVKRKNLESLKVIIEQGQQQGVFRKDVNINLIPPTVMGTFFHFYMNRPFYEELLDLKDDTKYNNYITNELILHIQQTIKALLLNEK